MKILITCPRAPVSIEWIRIFSRAGHDVTLVDSVSFPIAKYYKKTKFVKVASPRLEFEQYKEDMTKLITKTDWIIPNCEDIFFLAQVRDEIESDALFFMPESSLLFTMHHKFDFSKQLNEHVKFPSTKLLTEKSEIEFDEKTIIKPVYSRFGKSVIRNVTPTTIEDIEVTEAYPWVQQERIVGEAICNYALILNGEVLAHVAYRPKYLLNGAAATYFEPCVDERLEKFTEKFAKESNYTGQVAFDFIDDGANLYVLECNPRATSGLHILSEGLAFQNETFVYTKKSQSSAYRVGSTLYALFGLKALFSGELKQLNRDFKRAKDVLRGVSAYHQMLSMCGTIWFALLHRKDMTSATTFDIEYDG